jgi:hypothetical protein
MTYRLRSAQDRIVVDQWCDEKIGELTTQLARATARAEQAYATAEHQATAGDLTRLRTALLTTLATGADHDLTALRARLAQLVSAEEDRDGQPKGQR